MSGCESVVSPVRTLRPHSDWVTFLLPLDCGLCVSASDDGSLAVFSVADGSLRHTLRHDDWITAVTLLPETVTLAAAVGAATAAATAAATGDGGKCDATPSDAAGSGEAAARGAPTAGAGAGSGVGAGSGGGGGGGMGEAAAAFGRAQKAVAGCAVVARASVGAGAAAASSAVRSRDAAEAGCALPRRLLATGSRDKTVRVWDVSSGDCLRVFRGHTRSVVSISWSSLDCGRLVTACKAGAVRKWALDRDECVSCAVPDNGDVALLHFLEPHPDPALDRLFAATGNEVHVLDSSTCVAKLNGHTKPVTTVVALGDDVLFTGSADGDLRRWRVSASACTAVMSGHGAQVVDLIVLEGCTPVAVLSASEDGTLRWWDAETGACVAALDPDAGPATCVTPLRCGTAVAAGFENNSVLVWDGRHTPHVLLGHFQGVVCATVASDGQLVTGGRDRSVRLWQLPAHRRRHSMAALCVLVAHGRASLVRGVCANFLFLELMVLLTPLRAGQGQRGRRRQVGRAVAVDGCGGGGRMDSDGWAFHALRAVPVEASGLPVPRTGLRLPLLRLPGCNVQCCKCENGPVVCCCDEA